MSPESFIARKRSDWERLTALLNRAGAGLDTLSAEELIEMGRLYRQATSDLAVARRDFPRHQLAAYLNDLVARSHGAIYRNAGPRPATILTFFTTVFPQAFRATWPATLAAFLMFLIPALASFAITFRDPTLAGALLPGSEPVIEQIQNGEQWWLAINDSPAAASAQIMTNNIGVAIRAFAGGITLGVYTFWVLVTNGLLLGVVAGAAQRFGFAANLWGFVAAHGVIELSIIFIAGGAGLQLGWSILRPGFFSRRAALVVAARRAVLLLLGVVPLFIVAGLIEGFISPSNLPLWVKLTVAAGSGVALLAYLTLAGRTVPRDGDG